MLLPVAHETWFVDRVPPSDWGFASEPKTVVLLAVALVVAALFRLAARVGGGVAVPVLARLAPWMPFAVRLHLAVSLIGLLSGGWYLAPRLELEGATGVLLGVVAAVVAVMLMVGWRVRAAALLLVAAGPIGMLVYGVAPILQRADVLGLALFLVFAGAGRWSADEELGRARASTGLDLERATWSLRVAVGVALIAVAFVEKLANPDLAQAFIDSQAVDFNLAAAVGLPVDDLTFIRIAGAIEVLFGLLLLSGALPQLVVLLVGVPFNATLYFFGTVEMLGHLPLYAAMLVLLVYGSDARRRAWCSTLWPWPTSFPGFRRELGALARR
jgi:uncharacterized membrane protein YphA (DoxX/SURF4 family)